MALEDRVRSLFTYVREERSVEYKRSEPWEALEAKTVKTAMGMANLRGGGIIVIGVAQVKGTLELQGMDPAHLATYQADEVQAAANRFADPYVRLEIGVVEWEGKQFLGIGAAEFDEIPVVCKRSGIGVRLGAMYIRSNRLPETSEVQSQTEIREIIELATEKGVRRFLATAQRVGLPISENRAQSDRAAFDAQLGGL